MDQSNALPAARIGGLLSATFVFSVFVNLLMLTGPLFMLQVYDRVLGSRSEETLLALFMLVGALYALYWLLEYARGRVMERAGARLHSALAAPVFRAVLERAAVSKGRAEGSLQDLDAVRGLFASPVVLALFDIPWTPLFLAAIFVFHPLLGWLAVAGGGLLVAAALFNRALTARMVRVAGPIAGAALGAARQAEEGGEIIRAQGMRSTMTERWTRLQDDLTERSLRMHDWTGWFASFSKAFRFFLQSAMLAVGAWLVLGGEITAGAMIAASILLGRTLAPIETGIAHWQVVERARSGWRDIRALLGAHPEAPAPFDLPPPAARLELRNVSVAARRGDSPILHHVTFALAPGEAVGVIGRSGSGKTTLARVITGLVRPAMGEVRLGGATLDRYGTDGLGRHIGYLPQEVRLFEGTVAENIAQMALVPNAARVVEVAKLAQVHDIVLRLPEGYDTRIGAADARLSGGQKQRLALARSLYGDPAILVLDEPNSALDAEGSEALNAVVGSMTALGKAVVIMTHRPTAISACDTLVVLEGGRVTAWGPRDEIVRSTMRNAGDVARALGPSRAERVG